MKNKVAFFLFLLCCVAFFAAGGDSFISLSGADSEGHPNAFAWHITTPSGDELDFTGETIVVPFTEDGLWHIGMTAYYLHQSPLGPWPWVSETSATYTNVIFINGFETGTTGAWSATHGG